MPIIFNYRTAEAMSNFELWAIKFNTANATEIIHRKRKDEKYKCEI